MRFNILLGTITILLAFTMVSCGNEADRRGVGAQCASNNDCSESGQSCLTQFRGGYCGVQGCTNDVGCPDGSGCVTHTDGISYCFRICVDKTDCNRNRSVENESNCSSNVVFVEGANGRKACVPPSGT